MDLVLGSCVTSNSEGSFKIELRLLDGPLDMGWQHASATCEFVSDVMALRSEKSKVSYGHAQHTIAYLVNELLENSIKFKSAGDVSIRCSLEGKRFEIVVANPISQAAAAKFVPLLNEIVSRDPGELLIERIEQNAASEGSSASGLGILTLMNDYEAKMGWKFIDLSEDAVLLSTFASIEIN